MNKTAILFPGQGAQQVGMGRDLAERDPECRALFDAASEVLGYDLARICFDGPEAELTRSDHAQPAIFTVSVAAYAALRRAAPNRIFEAGAGLSSGEWTALHVAGVLSFEDTLRVLEARGRYMQKACEENNGAMLSVIGLTLDQLENICREADVELANLNSPEQTVLSGAAEHIERAEMLAKDAGAKRALRLNVAGAFHSRLMESAARQLGEFLETISFSGPEMTVVSNVTGTPFESVDDIKRRMVEQVRQSVRWVDGIRWMQAAGIGEYVECGPGRVLAGLVKRIDKQAVIHNIQDHSGLEGVLAQWGTQEV